MYLGWIASLSMLSSVTYMSYMSYMTTWRACFYSKVEKCQEYDNVKFWQESSYGACIYPVRDEFPQISSVSSFLF